MPPSLYLTRHHTPHTLHHSPHTPHPTHPTPLTPHPSPHTAHNTSHLWLTPTVTPISAISPCPVPQSAALTLPNHPTPHTPHPTPYTPHPTHLTSHTSHNTSHLSPTPTVTPISAVSHCPASQSVALTLPNHPTHQTSNHTTHTTPHKSHPTPLSPHPTPHTHSYTHIRHGVVCSQPTHLTPPADTHSYTPISPRPASQSAALTLPNQVQSRLLYEPYFTMPCVILGAVRCQPNPIIILNNGIQRLRPPQNYSTRPPPMGTPHHLQAPQ